MDIKLEQLYAFLEKNPTMSLAPSGNDEWIIKGKIALDITDIKYGTVQDYFMIQIIIPQTYPNEIPTVYEVGNRFPKTLDFHTYKDGSLCLGSPLSLNKRIKEDPTIEGFISNCIVPYLFTIALHLQGRGRFIFGELEHGALGILQDYLQIFNLTKVTQIISLLEILSMKKNIANKQLCPCGCLQLVTKCSFHKIVVEYRGIMTRAEFEKDKKLFIGMFEEYKRFEKELRDRKKIPLR